MRLKSLAVLQFYVCYSTIEIHMKKLTQSEYKEPDNTEVASLVIHQKPHTTNDQLIIFVHGLGGSRYGEKATWGNFPKFIFEDIQADIGMYEYKTLFSRLKFWTSISLKEEAEIFAGIIRDDLKNYKTIVLIGHSMGGLLCRATISRLVRTSEKSILSPAGERNILSRIGGLILMATPQLGSARVPKWLSFLSSDFYALRNHNDFISEINDTFEDHLYLDEHSVAVDRTTIPTWAVISAPDFWVDHQSAGFGLVSNRKKIVHGCHTDIVKPTNKESDVYSWVLTNIKKSLNRFKYDVFISSAMAGLHTEEDYKNYRNEAIHLEKILKSKCNFKSVFYAGRDIKTKAEFEAQNISLHNDFVALVESKYFLLLYPDKIVTSAIFEAGWALALGKPSVYYVRNRHDLPFLMAQAGDASLDSKVTIYEYDGRDRGEIDHLIASHGEDLWGSK